MMMTNSMRKVVPLAGLAAFVALFLYPVAQSSAQARRNREALPRTIAGGFFEASGVAHVPGTAGVLFVDDASNRAIYWMEVSGDGAQKAPALRIPIAADITDLEGITSDGTNFYVVGSQSKRTGFQGDGLVRFTFDPTTRRTDAVERIQGLKAWLAAHVPELKGTAQRVGDHVLNIEGIAWDPNGSRLLLGLRAPVVNGHALVVPVKLQDPRGAFSAANLRVDGATIRLPLGGAGVRSIEYDPAARAFRVITGAGLNAENRDFQIVEWKGDGSPSSLRVVASYNRRLKPEGITRATIDGRSVSVLVFDTSRFALID
jgi:hypothetical protein